KNQLHLLLIVLNIIILLFFSLPLLLS
ncbi:TPA: hypothetical protein ACN2J2_002676, partial [Staphylococcus aureus]